MLDSISKFTIKISDEVKKPSFILSNVLIPLGVMSFYLAVASLLLPEGVNKVFAARSTKYSLPITIFLFIVYFFFIGIKRSKEKISFTPSEAISARDLTLILFSLTPVVQYSINNPDILLWYEHIILFCGFALLFSIPIIAIPCLFRNTGSTRALMFLGLAFSYTITNMAVLSRHFSWYKNGSLRIQLLIFGSIWLVSYLIYKLNLRSFLYLLVMVYFISNSTSQLIGRLDTQEVADPSQAENLLISLIDSREPKIKPNIYLLVYDAYVENATMLAHGINNQAQEQFLEDQGFKLYPKTYSLKSHSIASMTYVLNSSPSYYGNRRKAVSGDGIVQNLFKNIGYETYGIFPIDYFFRGVIPSYDYSFPSYSSSLGTMVKAIFLGEFRFDVDFDVISRERYLHEKNVVLSEVSGDPKFIYMHSNYPNHSQDSGYCLPNEVELFRERLTEANLEMRQDVELIIENDPEVIVIVSGDHGPYLTKNCLKTEDDYEISEITRLDIQDRFGAFLAIRWPTSDFEDYDEITILQDIFPAVFAYIYADPKILESQLEPTIEVSSNISGASVVDGIINGGIHDGEPLFP